MKAPELQQIRRGLAFVFLSTAGSRAIALMTDVGLMRLLAVEAFGVMAFGLLVINTLNLVRSMGIGEALIFRQEVDQQSCDTAFVMALGLGLGLYAALFAGAPGIAWLAGEGGREGVVEVVRALGLLVLLQALASVPNALLERALDFEKRFYIDTLPALVYALVGLGLALAGQGVWSLVWGRLIAALAATAAAWWFSPWRPGWRWSWQRAREVGQYGRLVTAAALVSFLVVNVDDALVVRLAGVEALGFYARAYLLANFPATSVTHIASRVAFPAYARLRDRQREAAGLYARLVSGVMLISLPLAVGLLLLAGPFTLAVFGEKWAPIAPLLQWLSIYGLLRAFLSNTGPLFNALGAPQAILKVNLLQLAVLLAGLYPLIEWRGAEGACLGVLLGTLLSAPLALRYLGRLAGLGLEAQGAALRPFFLPAATMAVSILLLRLLAQAATESAWGEMLIAGMGGLAAYGGAFYWWERPALRQGLSLIQGRIDG